MKKQDQRIRKTVVWLGYSCNNHCVFCVDGGRRATVPDHPTETVLQQLVEARERGSDYLTLLGGELTIRPDIVDIVRFARSLGFEQIVMASNGRMLSYPDFAKALVDAGLTAINFSVHGHTAKLHDSLTSSPGSFEQLRQGMKNIRGLKGCLMGSNTTIVKPNYRHLEKIAENLWEWGVRNAEFIFVDPNRGYAGEDFDALVPRISDAAPFMRRCLDVGRRGKPISWVVRYVPLCYFQGYEENVSELKEGQNFIVEHIAPDFFNYDAAKGRAEHARKKTERCQGCSRYDRCEGIWIKYLEHYGDAELLPC